MVHHILQATKDTVHLGGFSHLLKPVLKIQSGDTVDVETYTGFHVCKQAPAEFLTPALIDIYHNLAPEKKISGGPHLLTGPIYVENAQPGNVLEIELQDIHPSLPVGFNAIRKGWGILPEKFDRSKLRFIQLDLENKVAEFPPESGIKIPLKPFFGILGVATPETQRNSIPPGNYGGNIDNQNLQAGAKLFLPIFLPGALFSIGDGHSAQGDGEVNVTAIETSMNGTIKLTVRSDLQVKTPIAETTEHIITMGFGENLDAALEMAVENTINWLQNAHNLSAEDAYVLCSLAVNFHITQAVNKPQKGVHGILSKSILPIYLN
ncbi:MAG: acetamidase/formamidase family protein [Cyanobacteria bacterium P01_A01_bin.45]